MITKTATKASTTIATAPAMKILTGEEVRAIVFPDWGKLMANPSTEMVNLKLTINTGSEKYTLNIQVPKGVDLLVASTFIPGATYYHHETYGYALKGIGKNSENSQGYGWQFYLSGGLPTIESADSRAFLKLDNVKANSDVEAELRFEFAIEDLPNQKGGKTTLAGCAGKADVRTDGQAYDARYIIPFIGAVTPPEQPLMIPTEFTLTQFIPPVPAAASIHEAAPSSLRPILDHLQLFPQAAFRIQPSSEAQAQRSAPITDADSALQQSAAYERRAIPAAVTETKLSLLLTATPQATAGNTSQLPYSLLSKTPPKLEQTIILETQSPANLRVPSPSTLTNSQRIELAQQLTAHSSFLRKKQLQLQLEAFGLFKKIKSTKEKIQQFETSLKQVKQLKQKIKELKEKIKELEEQLRLLKKSASSRREKLEEQLHLLKESAARTKEKLHELRAELRDSRKKLNSLASSTARLKSLKVSLPKMEKRLSTLKTSLRKNLRQLKRANLLLAPLKPANLPKQRALSPLKPIPQRAKGRLPLNLLLLRSLLFSEDSAPASAFRRLTGRLRQLVR